MARRLLVLISLSLGFLAACSRVEADASDLRDAHGPYRVVRIVDGDTVRVQLQDVSESVRYIGVDTPELHHPRRGEQPYGREAMEENRRLLSSGEVMLRYDVQPRDRYGRILAYVYLPDGTFVNAELVRRGFAQIMTIPPNVRHADLFRQLEREARAAQVGLWALH